MPHDIKCWVITSDKKGTIHQASGIPIRLDIDPEYKTIKLSKLAKFLGHINIKMLTFFKTIKDISILDMPILAISSGHDGLLTNAYLKAKYPNLITVHIQNPGALIRYFNLVAIPKHDDVKFSKKYQSKVITTQMSLHHLTSQKLAEEGEKFANKFNIINADKPSIFFSIGGKAVGYDLNDLWIEKFCDSLINLQNQYRIFITTSRRTQPEHRIKIQKLLLDTQIINIDNYEYNYYIGALDKCDFICITEESISMISEACFTQKHIFVLKIPGFRKKINKFTANLQKKQYITYLEVDNLSFKKSFFTSINDDNNIVAESVKNILIKYGYKL